MEPTGGQDSRLHLQLKESSSRFQTLMQRLLAKVGWGRRGGEGAVGRDPELWRLTRSPSPQYNQPFEDAPLVQMATLTYETPQGTEPSLPVGSVLEQWGLRICNAALVPLPQWHFESMHC